MELALQGQFRGSVMCPCLIRYGSAAFVFVTERKILSDGVCKVCVGNKPDRGTGSGGQIKTGQNE